MSEPPRKHEYGIEAASMVALVTALGLGLSFGGPTDYATFRKQSREMTFPPAPPKPLTKRQKRRLRGKQRAA